jgi:hypothetical protein
MPFFITDRKTALRMGSGLARYTCAIPACVKRETLPLFF